MREIKKDFQFALESFRIGGEDSLIDMVDDNGKQMSRSISKDFLYEVTLIFGG